jgi:DNA-binding response OmpR family regulator
MTRILVIDDDEAVRRMVVRILTYAKHEVFEAADGDEGIKQFKAYSPALVVTDIIMPDKEGIEVIREIRAMAPETRILAVSGGMAGGNTDYLDMTLKLGADAVLPKPFRPADLIKAVDRLIETAGEFPSAA